MHIPAAFLDKARVRLAGAVRTIVLQAVAALWRPARDPDTLRPDQRLATTQDSRSVLVKSNLTRAGVTLYRVVGTFDVR